MSSQQYLTRENKIPAFNDSSRGALRRALLVCLFIALAVARPASNADELTAKEITAARKIYVAKCSKCHRFYEPTNYAEPDWRIWMEKMNQKSKLKGEQTNSLTRYLDAYRAGRLPGKPEDDPKTTNRSGAVR
jgi:cytochrome c553